MLQADFPTPLVLDTNVVLDWQVFRDPGSQRLWQALADRRVQPLATPALLAELFMVLQRPLDPRWDLQRERTLSNWDHWHQGFVVVTGAVPSCRDLRCTDPSDQKFLDLAVHAGARFLVTRDKALLRLRRRATTLGLHIIVPSDWPGDAADVAPA